MQESHVRLGKLKPSFASFQQSSAIRLTCGSSRSALNKNSSPVDNEPQSENPETMFNKRFTATIKVAIFSLISVFSGINSESSAYVTRHQLDKYQMYWQYQQARQIADINKEFYGTPSERSYATPPGEAQHRAMRVRTDAYTRHRDWVWVPQRNMWLLNTPGARTEDKPNQRPFGPLGIGQQPQIFKTRLSNGREILTDYFGNKYRAPHVLGTAKPIAKAPKPNASRGLARKPHHGLAV